MIKNIHRVSELIDFFFQNFHDIKEYTYTGVSELIKFFLKKIHGIKSIHIMK